MNTQKVSDEINLSSVNTYTAGDRNNLTSFDSIEMAKLVYNDKGNERYLGGDTIFYRPKTIKFFDSFSGKYFTKTLYIPESYDSYYTPNDSDMRNLLLSKFDLLSSTLSSLEDNIDESDNAPSSDSGSLKEDIDSIKKLFYKNR